MSNNRKSGFLLGAIIGGILGAVGGILFAPKKGTEVRKDLKNKLDQYQEKAGEVLQDVQKKANTLGKDITNKSFGKKEKTDEKEKPSSVKKKRFFKGI